MEAGQPKSINRVDVKPTTNTRFQLIKGNGTCNGCAFFCKPKLTDCHRFNGGCRGGYWIIYQNGVKQ